MNLTKELKMITLLIDPLTKTPAASIEENAQERTLTIFDKELKKNLKVNGITLSEKKYGVWRVFPDGNPKTFLEAFEKDLFNHGLMQKGYYWIKQENYDNEQEWLKSIAQSIIRAS